MSARTTNDEVTGSIIHVLHVDESGLDPVRTLLALVTKEDLNLTIEDESEDFNPAAERRTRRIRTNNTVDLEAATPFAADMSAMELIGFVDANGQLATDPETRRLRPEDNEYIEIAYQTTEGATYADAELVHRFEDVEFTSPEVDLSASPPITSFTAWVHGNVYLAYDEGGSGPTTVDSTGEDEGQP